MFIKGYKDWSKLYESKQDAITRTFLIGINSKPQKRAEYSEGMTRRREVLAKWTLKILPDMLKAMHETISEIPDGFSFKVLNMTPNLDKFESDTIQQQVSRVLFLDATIAQTEDTFFQDIIDDLELDEHVEINIALKPSRDWLPFPKDWLVFPGRRGPYDVALSSKKQGKVDNARIHRWVFNTTMKTDDSALEIMAATATSSFLERDTDMKGILQVVRYGDNKSDFAPTFDWSYKDIFENPLPASNKKEDLERIFSDKLDKKLIKILNKHIEDGEYFKDMMTIGNVEVQEL